MDVAKARILFWLVFMAALFLTGCHDRAWNNPYPKKDATANYYYSSFSQQPKTLDPAKSYSSDESTFVAQVYEPCLQYNYLLRPYTLEPLTAAAMPTIKYYDKNGKILPTNADPNSIAFSTYEIHLKPGIYYQPHPAFAKDKQGNYYYFHLSTKDLDKINTLNDFKYTGTRELTADDYVYEIKRLADPQIQSPIYGVMSGYIVGFPELSKLLQAAHAKAGNQFVDLRNYPLAGVKVLDKYTYQITIKGIYPQFIYWLEMPFFAPIPWEADYFYSQPGMNEKNINFGWYPVGTGAYMLTENNPNRQMVLTRNPYFHEEYFPTTGMPGDAAAGYLKNAGKRLPFVDKFIFTLEKETIPRWTKFLQGYYDRSTISSDSFEQSITFDDQGNPIPTPALRAKGISLITVSSPSIYYYGFNMLDPVVGGYTPKARALRQAISIAFDTQELITIFMNGRGTVAQSPIPPGIFGYREGAAGVDPYVYQVVNGQVVQRSLEDAKRLMIFAGYPNGIDPKTGRPLLLTYDDVSGGGNEDKAMLDWLRKQFAKLGIQLDINSVQYNLFQEKVRTGQAQLFSWGWQADYPDPENFLFLLYGPNGKVHFDGENAVNYQNKEFDSLFVKMRNMPNGPERQAVIDRMVAIAQQDSPWIWGFSTKDFILLQSWSTNNKPNVLISNNLKYASIDPVLRAEKRNEWNQPILWPFAVLAFIIIFSVGILSWYYWRKQHTPLKREPQ